MYLQKVISRKNCVKNLFFAGILKVNDENSRFRIQDPDPDPLVRSMDPRIRIRIRIHPKMSWIRNIAFWAQKSLDLPSYNGSALIKHITYGAVKIIGA
jgi:hypothetical protein